MALCPLPLRPGSLSASALRRAPSRAPAAGQAPQLAEQPPSRNGRCASVIELAMAMGPVSACQAEWSLAPLPLRLRWPCCCCCAADPAAAAPRPGQSRACCRTSDCLLPPPPQPERCQRTPRRPGCAATRRHGACPAAPCLFTPCMPARQCHMPHAMTAELAR